MNFDEVNIQQLHAQTFQTIDLLQLKAIWSDCLPNGVCHVTDFSELNLHVTKLQLLQLRWVDLTLPFGIYSNEKLVFLFDPYARELHTEDGGMLEQNRPNVSIVDFLIAHGQTFHDPDSYSLKMENAYGLSPHSQWKEFGLPKVKDSLAFGANLLITLGVTSFQVVLSKTKLFAEIESWAKRTRSNYTVESSGKWIWSKTYKVRCDVSQLSECALHELVSMASQYEEWEGVRFLIPTETGTVSLFIGGDLTQGYGYGLFQYEHPSEVVFNEI